MDERSGHQPAQVRDGILHRSGPRLQPGDVINTPILLKCGTLSYMQASTTVYNIYTLIFGFAGAVGTAIGK